MSLRETQALIEVGQWLGERGWVPATGGNLSMRIADGCLVTASGTDKGRLQVRDFLSVDARGESLERNRRPSAETLIHAEIYALMPEVGAVLHVHTVNATVLSRLCPNETLVIDGYEMQKSLEGIRSHDEPARIAVFDNSQDMVELAARVRERHSERPLQHGFLVRAHGLYAWGESVEIARRHVEGLEFLFECEYRRRLLERS